MNANGALARLIAGLAEEERIARAIDDKQIDSGWGVSYNPYGLANTPPGWYITPHIGLAYESEGAEHISRQDPKATLERVAAHRRVMYRYEAARQHYDALAGSGVDVLHVEQAKWRMEGLADAIEALAAIYPESTEPEADPQ